MRRAPLTPSHWMDDEWVALHVRPSSSLVGCNWHPVHHVDPSSGLSVSVSFQIHPRSFAHSLSLSLSNNLSPDSNAHVLAFLRNSFFRDSCGLSLRRTRICTLSLSAALCRSPRPQPPATARNLPRPAGESAPLRPFRRRRSFCEAHSGKERDGSVDKLVGTCTHAWA